MVGFVSEGYSLVNDVLKTGLIVMGVVNYAYIFHILIFFSNNREL